MFKVIVCGALALIGLALVLAQPDDEMDPSNLKSEFLGLEQHLLAKVSTDGLEENLAAAKKLVESSSEHKSACWSLRSKKCKDKQASKVRAAIRFVDLLEVGEGHFACSRQTVDYLDDTLKADRREFDGFLPRSPGRVHKLIYSRFRSIVSKCAKAFDEMHNIKLDGLPQETKEAIFTTLSDEEFPEPDIRTHEKKVTDLMRKFEPKELDAAIQSARKSGSAKPFVDYFKQAQRRLLESSCSDFEANFKEVMGPMQRLVYFGFVYKVDVSLGKKSTASLRRHNFCESALEMSRGDDAGESKAKQMYESLGVARR